MLTWVNRLQEMSFQELMQVYREDNQENGREFCPEEPEMRQLQLAEEEFYRYLKESFFSVPGARYAVWVVDGRYVSALRLEPYRDGLLLEALSTHPEHRCRGYATALIRAVQEDLGAGKIYSHVGKKNIPSRKTHESCGFHIFSHQAVYIDGSVNGRAYTMCYEGK